MPDRTKRRQPIRPGDKPPDGGPARGNPLPLVLAILALIAVAVAGGLGYRSWSELKADLAADGRTPVARQQSRQQQLQQSLSSAAEAVRAQEAALGEQRDVLAQQRIAIDEARAAFRQQEQKLAEENLRLQEREAELRAAVADVHRRVGSFRAPNGWSPETDYLLRIANDRLILARDTETARVAPWNWPTSVCATPRTRVGPGCGNRLHAISPSSAPFEAPDSAGLSAGCRP